MVCSWRFVAFTIKFVKSLIRYLYFEFWNSNGRITSSCGVPGRSFLSLFVIQLLFEGTAEGHKNNIHWPWCWLASSSFCWLLLLLPRRLLIPSKPPWICLLNTMISTTSNRFMSLWIHPMILRIHPCWAIMANLQKDALRMKHGYRSTAFLGLCVHPGVPQKCRVLQTCQREWLVRTQRARFSLTLNEWRNDFSLLTRKLFQKFLFQRPRSVLWATNQVSTTIAFCFAPPKKRTDSCATWWEVANVEMRRLARNLKDQAFALIHWMTKSEVSPRWPELTDFSFLLSEIDTIALMNHKPQKHWPLWSKRSINWSFQGTWVSLLYLHQPCYHHRVLLPTGRAFQLRCLALVFSSFDNCLQSNPLS